MDCAFLPHNVWKGDSVHPDGKKQQKQMTQN